MTAGKSLVFKFADVEVRERELSLIKSGQALTVEPKVFRVLLLLLRNPQKLVTKGELLNSVWGDAAVTENSLTQSILKLRRVLDDDARNPRYIETVATVGYRFVCVVAVCDDAPANPGPSRRPPTTTTGRSRSAGASSNRRSSATPSC